MRRNMYEDTTGLERYDRGYDTRGYGRSYDRPMGNERYSDVRSGTTRGRVDYGNDAANLGSARSDYGRNAYRGRLDDAGIEEDRGILDRATVEGRSLFGVDEAVRGRRMDEREGRVRGALRDDVPVDPPARRTSVRHLRRPAARGTGGGRDGGLRVR